VQHRAAKCLLFEFLKPIKPIKPRNKEGMVFHLPFPHFHCKDDVEGRRAAKTARSLLHFAAHSLFFEFFDPVTGKDTQIEVVSSSIPHINQPKTNTE